MDYWNRCLIMVVEKKTDYPGVRTRNNKIWIDFRHKGIRCREAIGLDVNKKNILIAYLKRQAVLYESKLNILNYADHFPNSKNLERFGGGPKSNMTISEAIDWWLKNYSARMTDNQIKIYTRDIKNHIKPFMGDFLLNNITALQISHWLEGLELSESTKNSIITPLKALLEAAFIAGALKEKLHEKITCFTRKKHAKDPYTIHDIDKLLPNLPMHASYFYQFKFWSGLSTGEQIGLQWGDVDFKNYRIKIQRQLAGGKRLKKPKNGFRVRTIDLLEPSYQALLAVKPKDYDKNPQKYKEAWVFTNPITNDHWRIDGVTKPFKKACHKLGIKYKSGYKTRHTFASIMVSSCLPDGWVRNQMGHGSMKMLEETYGKFYENADEVREWLHRQTQNGHNGKLFNEFFFEKQ